MFVKLIELPFWLTFRAICLVASIVKSLVTFLAPRVAYGLTVLAAFTAIIVATVHYGSKAIEIGRSSARDSADRAYAWVTERIDGIEVLSVRRAPEVPRAVAYVPEEPTEQPVSLLERAADAIDGVAETLGGTLFPSGSNYPQVKGLPKIEGKILERAGGHRLQTLIGEVLPVVHQVEASGKVFGVRVGDTHLREKAYGPLQVRQDACEDLADRFGVSVRSTRCQDNWELSEYVFRLYVGYWANWYERETGKVATGDLLCRIWNGGPFGYSKKSTVKYLALCREHQPDVTRLVASAE